MNRDVPLQQLDMLECLEKLVFILLHRGPGAVNGLSGLADAWFDSFPIIGICGNVPTNEMKGYSGIRQNGFQEMDLISMTRIYQIFRYS